jgi:mRNA-degrading endonuclease toxin of MazEF toxin-antitoxin module
LTASAGEIWLADRGDETRRLVFVVSDERFHRLAERAVVAPVLDVGPASPRPWHIPLSERTIAVNQLATMPVDRLLELVERAGLETLRRVRHAVGQITN